jgi:hypothetical protein
MKPSFSAPGTNQTLMSKPAPWDWRALSDQTGKMAYDASMSSINAANKSSAMDPAQAQAKANEAEFLGNARGRVDELRNDPVDAMVLKALQARASGASQPYDATTRSAMFTGQSEMAAAAMQNQLANLHGNPSDPSYQAQLTALQGQRQQALQGARLGIDQQANLANYNAQGAALGQTGAFNQSHNAGITDAQRYLGDFLQRQNFASQADMAGGQAAGPSYSSFYTSTLGGPSQTQVSSDNWAPSRTYSTPMSGNSTAGHVAPAQPVAPQTHTLTTGNTWGGQPYGGAPAAPAAPRPATGTGYVYNYSNGQTITNPNGAYPAVSQPVAKNIPFKPGARPANTIPWSSAQF